MVSPVFNPPQQISTVANIVTLVRRLTASSGESSLSTQDIYNEINTFMNQAFPYAIKMDQMRAVYTFFTEPYRDRYPVDVNYWQGFRDPMYVEGIQGLFYKSRDQFYNLWPRFPTKFAVPSTNQGTITGVTNANPAVVTTNTASLINNDQITITGINGMTDLNNNTYTITILSPTTLSLNVDSTLFGVYTSGGMWTTTTLNFTIPAPFLTKEVVLGGVDVGGNPISVNDDGNGNLLLQVPNGVTVTPPLQEKDINGNPIPGMLNRNTNNPGLIYQGTQTVPFTNAIGSVNYQTGVFNVNFPIAPNPAIPMTLWVSQYQPGRPYTLMFWNNEMHVRPIPKFIHKIEIEAYQTPVQFMATTDNPILNQWWKYIGYGVAIEILRQRQDVEGINNLMEGFTRQEGLVLERQGVEEIGQRNTTIFSSTIGGLGNLGNNHNGFY
jgi:hypothetical protein